eukprot:6178387-Pleurochrysis_carterae.AAC.1
MCVASCALAASWGSPRPARPRRRRGRAATLLLARPQSSVQRRDAQRVSLVRCKGQARPFRDACHRCLCKLEGKLARHVQTTCAIALLAKEEMQRIVCGGGACGAFGRKGRTRRVYGRRGSSQRV